MTAQSPLSFSLFIRAYLFKTEVASLASPAPIFNLNLKQSDRSSWSTSIFAGCCRRESSRIPFGCAFLHFWDSAGSHKRGAFRKLETTHLNQQTVTRRSSVCVLPEDLYWRRAINHTLPTVTCGWTGYVRNLFSAPISKLIRQLFTFIYELRIGNSTPRRYQSSHLSVSGGSYGPPEFGAGICIFSVSRRTRIVSNEILLFI